MIDFKDEILADDPKFYITDNGDGTYDIKLATEVIQEGTNVNKFLFENIDEGSQDFTELDDLKFQSGVVTNAGAGWNSVNFEEEFDDIPEVVTQIIGDIYRVQIQNITSKGFQYRIVQNEVNTELTLTPTKSSYYVSSRSSWTGVSTNIVSDVTGTAETSMDETNVEDTNIKFNYIALCNGGKE